MIATSREYPSAEIFLDGSLVPDCFYADDEKGIVRQFVRNADGVFFPGPSGKGLVWRESTGKVEIRLSQEDGA